MSRGRGLRAQQELKLNFVAGEQAGTGAETAVAGVKCIFHNVCDSLKFFAHIFSMLHTHVAHRRQRLHSHTHTYRGTFIVQQAGWRNEVRAKAARLWAFCNARDSRASSCSRSVKSIGSLFLAYLAFTSVSARGAMLLHDSPSARQATRASCPSVASDASVSVRHMCFILGSFYTFLILPLYHSIGSLRGTSII